MRITVIRHSIQNRGGDKLGLDYFAFLADKGHQIIYWTNEIRTDFPIHPKIEIKQIPFPTSLGTLFFAWSKKFETDIVFVDLVITACAARRHNRSKLVYMAQGNDVSYHRSSFYKSFVEYCYRKILNDPAVLTITVSEKLAEAFKAYASRKLPVINNGVPLKEFYPERTAAQQRTKKFVVLVFSRKDVAKGLDVAEQALRQLKTIRTQDDWEIWGIGAEKLGWDFATVTDMGFHAEPAKLRGILSSGDIFLLPSRSEGLSLLLLYAMACECAIVATTAANILTNETDGMVSPVEDAKALAHNLNRLMNEDLLREKLKKNARVLAEKFDSEKSAEQLEQTLLTFLKDRS